MKSIEIYFIIFFLSSLNVFAQLADDNTNAIKQYFTNIEGTPVTNSNENKDVNPLSFQMEQAGTMNLIHVNSLQLGDKQTVKQKGSKNTYAYYTYYNVEKSNITITQTGNSNSLQIFGENSLMKNAIINQKSNFQELIIKNYSNSF